MIGITTSEKIFAILSTSFHLGVAVQCVCFGGFVGGIEFDFVGADEPPAPS
jgi:hypothetical protein